jgi:malonyl CoA-acyl carrier protein transacylase
MSIACVFPGRGSQSVGMLQALAREHPQVRDTFDEASQHLGLQLHGPVRWVETIGHMVDKGIVDILELGRARCSPD